MPLIRFPTVKGLVYTIDLSKIADRENPRTVEAPIIYSATYPEPIVIDWGDGSTPEVKNSGQWPSHEYAAAGVYQVTIRSTTGSLPQLSFSQDGSTTPAHNLTVALITLDHFCGSIGTNNPTLLYNLRNTANLEYIDTRYTGLPSYISMSNCFRDSGISQELNTFVFDFITTGNFNSMFSQCRKLRGHMPPIPSGAIEIGSIVLDCQNIEGEIPPLPSSLTGMAYAFYNCRKLTGPFPTIPNSVQNSLDYTFYECQNLAGKMPNIPDGVTSLRNTFYQCKGATAFPDSIGNTITDVRLTFYNCIGLNTSANAAPELWDTANYPNIDSGKTDRCFGDLTNLSNYADIPAGWK